MPAEVFDPGASRTRVRYGYRRIHVLLKREGWQVGRHQLYRLHGEEQLQLRSKLPRRRKMVVSRRQRIQADSPNHGSQGSYAG